MGRLSSGDEHSARGEVLYWRLVRELGILAITAGTVIVLGVVLGRGEMPLRVGINQVAVPVPAASPAPAYQQSQARPMEQPEGSHGTIIWIKPPAPASQPEDRLLLSPPPDSNAGEPQ